MLFRSYSELGVVPAPEERQVAICFTDIRGFTAKSEIMDPPRLFAALSSHLQSQIGAVYRFGGYVDKFNGDGLMAIFDGPDMVRQCADCALTIMEEAEKKSSAIDQFPIGIGIHTGRVFMGNIGSSEHLDFSIVGATVNLAARLCGFALPGKIVVSDAVHQQLADNPEFQLLDPRDVQIRGVRSLVRIYRLQRTGALD